jgi:thymidylate kinase
LCCRGLECARWTREGLIFGDGPKLLTEQTRSALERHIRQLNLDRSPVTDDTIHSLDRTAAERSVESVVLESPAQLDALLHPKYVYSQVSALAAGDRG